MSHERAKQSGTGQWQWDCCHCSGTAATAVGLLPQTFISVDGGHAESQSDCLIWERVVHERS